MAGERTESNNILKIGNVELIGDSSKEFTAQLHTLITLDLKSVRDSLIAYAAQCHVLEMNDEPTVIYTFYRLPTIADTSVVDLSPFEYDDESTGESYTVSEDGQLIISAEIDDPENFDDLLEVVRPFLRTRGLEIIGLGSRRVSYFNTLKIGVSSASVERYTIRDIVEVLRSVRLLLSSGHLDLSTAEGVYLAATSGNVEILIGSPEGRHFDAKEKGYTLRSDEEKFEFSLDLASFANTDMGGVILLGVATKKDPNGQDVVDRVPGCRPGSLNLMQMTDVANSWIVPPIEGLELRLATALEGKHLCVIFVPPQPAYTQPFVVRRGTIDRGKISGSVVTVPYRTGHGKLTMSPEALHSLLVAGRAALNARDEGRRHLATPAKIMADRVTPEHPPIP